jgi:hypothetical protein
VGNAEGGVCCVYVCMYGDWEGLRENWWYQKRFG